jgi:hypothetical protein
MLGKQAFYHLAALPIRFALDIFETGGRDG